MAHEESLASSMKLTICSLTPRLSQSLASLGRSGFDLSSLAFKNLSTSGNLRENAWLAAAARLNSAKCLSFGPWVESLMGIASWTSSLPGLP